MAEEKKNLLTEIYREVGETKTSVKGLDKKVDTHIDKTEQALKDINEQDAEQNIILSEHKQSLDLHIEGVNTLRDMHVAHRREAAEQMVILREALDIQRQECDARIEALEKPYDLVKLMGKVAVWLGGVAGAIYGIIRLLGVL